MLPSHERHCQHLAGRIRWQEPWDRNERKWGQAFPEKLHVPAFLFIIGFGQNLLFDFINGGRRDMSGGLRRPDDGPKDFEVVLDRLPNPRILNLDRYRSAFARDGFMYLPQRSCRKGLRGKFAEDVFRLRAHAATELDPRQ